MNSVERIKQYTCIPQEKADDQSKPPKEWPKYGEIKLKNLTVSYNDRDVVLDNITATIKAREKVGVVGRTGAGKRSVIFHVTITCLMSLNFSLNLLVHCSQLCCDWWNLNLAKF